VQNGLQTVVYGKESVVIAEKMFDQIKTNSEEVLNQAESLRCINERLLQSAHNVAEEMGTVAAISDKSSASIQEVLANADVQQKRVSSMVERIEELTELMKTLDHNINR